MLVEKFAHRPLESFREKSAEQSDMRESAPAGQFLYTNLHDNDGDMSRLSGSKVFDFRVLCGAKTGLVGRHHRPKQRHRYASYLLNIDF